MKKILIVFVCLILCLGTMASCGDYLNAAPQNVNENRVAGDSVEISASILKLEQSLEPSAKKDGYIEKISVSAKITGYDADYTYFDGSVRITWTYLEISDANPTGIEVEIIETIALDASGNGSLKKDFPLEGCRGVSNIRADYEFFGDATKL